MYFLFRHDPTNEQWKDCSEKKGIAELTPISNKNNDFS